MSESVSTVKNAIQRLLSELEGIATMYDEYTDTEVCEAMHRALTHYFVWNQAGTSLPVSFGMSTEDGDARVRAALASFLGAVHDASEIAVGKARLDMLQDRSMRAAGGMHYYELFGHRDAPLPLESLPKHMFIKGKYDD
jgi:hypothetical protein